MNKLLEQMVKQHKHDRVLKTLRPMSKGLFGPEPAYSSESYDNHNAFAGEDSIAKMLASAYKILVDGVYKDDATGEENIATSGGTGFLVGPDLFMTCEHVTSMPETLSDWMTGKHYTLQDTKHYLVAGATDDSKTECDLVRANADVDIATVKPKTVLGLDKLVDIADKPLAQGDFVYAVGYPLLIGRFMTSGIITNLGETDDYFFYESCPINPGNSGGPSYVLDRGEPRIAGVNEFLIRGTQGMFGAVHYRHIKEELELAQTALRGE